MGCCTTAIEDKKSRTTQYNNSNRQQGNSPSKSTTQNQSELPIHLLYSQNLIRVIKLIQYEAYPQAIDIYQNYIQQHISEDPGLIDGLGQYQWSLGYFQWSLFGHYQQGITKRLYRGTVYDALALCLQAVKGNEDEYQKALKWYREMIDKYPDNYAIMIGCAHLLNNKGIFEEAIFYYKRVHKLQPKWTRPLQCLALIYEYERIRKTQGNQTCNQILKINPNNRVALFVLALNEITSDSKISKLTQLTKLHPNFVRAHNEIGIEYGSIKDKPLEAISWYKRAIEIAPLYSCCYNNIGINHEQLKNYPQAMKWYFMGIEKQKEYKAPHANLIKVYSKLKYTFQQVDEEIKKHHVLPDYYYYMTALAYYDMYGKSEEREQVKMSLHYFIKAYQYAKTLKKQNYKIYNSIGMCYDDLNQNERAIGYYSQAIKDNPKYCIPYYHTAILYKKQGNIQKAIQWYQEAIKVNPRYSQAYNNLGNIYRNQQKYVKAIKCYRYAVKHNSTYTLALANLGVCLLKSQNFHEAFNAMERAKESLLNDNNHLSKNNQSFLQEKLQLFEKEGQAWRQKGCITPQQQQKLKGLIKSFDSRFKTVYITKNKNNMNQQTVMKPQIIQILKLVRKDQLKLTQIDQIFEQIAKLSQQNKDYFIIFPQLCLKFFYNETIINKRPFSYVQTDLRVIVERLEKAYSSENKQDNKERFVFKMKHFDPPSSNKVNLFKQKYFNNYKEVYAEVKRVNDRARESFSQFKTLTDLVRNNSCGIPYGVGMKMPADSNQQFKVILRIFEKMFKTELTEEQKKSSSVFFQYQLNEQKFKTIYSKIDSILNLKHNIHSLGKTVNMCDIMDVLIDSWIQEITNIVIHRKQRNIETKFEVSDLVRGKIMYQSVDHIKQAVEEIDTICHEKHYQIIEMDNRLSKRQTQDLVFKIRIKEAVCELQLAMNQEDSQCHLNHALYQLLRSPLGCIYGCCIYMSKVCQYSFLQNCKEIVRLMMQKEGDKEGVLNAAQYVVQNLNEGSSLQASPM